MKLSHLIIMAALVLVSETIAKAADTLNLPVVFELERASTVTVVIEDAAGKRVRNLAAAVRLSPGKNLLSWDGYDDGELQKDGSTLRHRVLPGKYRARGITSDGVRLIYEFPVNSPGTPPWFTKERDGAWLADHTAAQGVVFAPASDSGFLGRGQARLIVSAKTAECGDAFMALDMNGKKIIGNSDFGWNGAYAMTLDRGPQAPMGDSDPWLYCLLVEKKEVILNVFSRSGKTGTPFKQTTSASVTWNGGKIGDSVSAWNGIVVISVPHEKVLLVVDPRVKDSAKRLLGRIAQEDPRGVLFDPQGRLLVATARQVKRLTLDFATATVLREEVVVAQDLEDAQQLTQDKTGNLYVGDWGKQHVVKVFDPAGKLVRTIGKPGGPQLGGNFDNERLHYPKGLAIDERGQLWVVDVDHLPKRITTWSAADGKLLRTFIGGPKYGGGGTLDPQDRTRMFYGIFNGGYTMKLDWAKGTAVVDSVYTRPEQWAGLDRDKTIGVVPEDAIHIGASTYLVPNFNGGGNNPSECMVWQLGNDGVAVPVAVIGGTHFQEEAHGGWNAARNPGIAELFKKMPSSHLMIWSDRNRDGRAQPEEFTSWPTATPYIGQGIRFNADLSFTVRGLAVPAPDFLPNGVPVWPSTRAPVSVTGEERPANTVATTDGWVVNVNWDKQRDILGFRNNQRMWDYPSLEGTHIPSNPGTVIMARRFLGAPFAPKQGEAGMIFGINGEKGSMYLMTTDGLFIQDIGGDTRVLPIIGSKYPKVERGMVVEGISFYDEHYGPSLSQTKEGDVVLIAGKEFSAVFRVDGLASIKRREFSTFDLDAAHLAGLPETLVLPARQQGRLSLSVGIGGVAPQVDGNLTDWGPDTAWATLDDRASAALRIVGDRLFAAWRTGDPNALSNAPGDPKFIFKHGGAVDLMIATDPKAKPRRLEPAAGDIRLLATLQAGKPTAVLYRAVVPGTSAADRVPFESPVGRVDFDRVEVVSDKIELAQRGGDIELSIPLAVLGLNAVSDGTLLHGDLGLLRGSGAMTSQRLYWNNLDTAICSDIPSEARLMPANWGTWRLLPQAMLSRIEATAPPKDLVPGLAWRYAEGNWNAATDLSKQPVKSSGNAPLPDLKGIAARPENFGVIYEGFIEVPRAGAWTLSGMVNDSCRIWVSGFPVVDDTGAGGNGGHDYEGSTMQLAAGLHPLRIEFIQKGGSFGFRLDWTGPEQPKKQIPAAVFKRKP